MAPITLDEMKTIRLMNRTDQKYLTTVPTLLKLLELTRPSYYTQEVDGLRVSPYSTLYFDKPGRHSMFQQHQTGHVPRQKVRVRTYESSCISFLEVKNKDNHGKTRKLRIPVPSVEAVTTQKFGEDFIREHTGLDFDDISPTVGNHFKRITLVNQAKTERLTIDFDISFFNYQTGEESEISQIVVIELKRDGRIPSPILPLLRQLRIKPASFSKYCIGATFTGHDLQVNRFKKRLIKIKKVAEKA